jgi:DNA (cytosine-5)-methyltransferase 1
MARSVELFAGAGGMALGMLRAGFEHDQLVELHKAPCEILRTNAQRDPALWKSESTRQMDVGEWLRESATQGLRDIDLVAGGPPCQPFSIGGARAGHADERNMFPVAIDVVRELRPKTFVFENVPGLLREDFLPYYLYLSDYLTRPSIRPREDEDWTVHHDRIRRARLPVEYHVRREIIDAADLGIPQTRKRIFIIGIRADVGEPDTWQTLNATHSRAALLHAQWVSGSYWMEHGLIPPAMPEKFRSQVDRLRRAGEVPLEMRWRTTRDAIADLPYPINGQAAPSVLNHEGIPGARSYRGHTGGWFDWPAKTLKAGVHGVCGGEGMIRFTDGSIRYLTVREAARIQTFPDDYQLPELRGIAMRALGNAVAVDVAAAIGSQLLAVTRIA